MSHGDGRQHCIPFISMEFARWGDSRLYSSQQENSVILSCEIFSLYKQTCTHGLATLQKKSLKAADQNKLYSGVYSLVRTQGLHPSEAGFVGGLYHSAATRPVQIRRVLQMQLTNTSFFSPDLKDGSGVSFMAYTIPWFIVGPNWMGIRAKWPWQ